MIRAMIGTVAVLAGFAVVEHSVDASTGLAGSCKATQAYAVLPAGEQVAVRAEPTPEGSLVGILAAQGKSDTATSIVMLTGSQNGWARIALKSAKDFTASDDRSPALYGWVPADMLAVDSRIDGAITTYSRPGVMGVKTGTIEGDDMRFRILGCRGEWLQVINSERGNTWIDRWCAKEEGCRG